MYTVVYVNKCITTEMLFCNKCNVPGLFRADVLLRLFLGEGTHWLLPLPVMVWFIVFRQDKDSQMYARIIQPVEKQQFNQRVLFDIIIDIYNSDASSPHLSLAGIFVFI